MPHYFDQDEPGADDTQFGMAKMQRICSPEVFARWYDSHG